MLVWKCKQGEILLDWDGPKPKDRCPHKRQKRRDTGTGEKPHGGGDRDGRDAAMCPGLPGGPRSWKRQEGASPEEALPCLDLRGLVSRARGGWFL